MKTLLLSGFPFSSPPVKQLMSSFQFLHSTVKLRQTSDTPHCVESFSNIYLPPWCLQAMSTRTWLTTCLWKLILMSSGGGGRLCQSTCPSWGDFCVSTLIREDENDHLYGAPSSWSSPDCLLKRFKCRLKNHLWNISQALPSAVKCFHGSSALYNSHKLHFKFRPQWPHCKKQFGQQVVYFIVAVLVSRLSCHQMF